MIISCCFRVVALSGNAALALSPSCIAPELNRIQLSVICRGVQSQGHTCSQPHSPGWARGPLSSFFPRMSINFSYFSSNFTYFFPHFGPLGGRVAHPGRPWLRHWAKQQGYRSIGMMLLAAWPGPLGHPSAASGACAVEQISSSKRQCGKW